MNLQRFFGLFLEHDARVTDSLQGGRVPERTNGTVSKTVVGLGLPRVQIPPLPPIFQ